MDVESSLWRSAYYEDFRTKTTGFSPVVNAQCQSNHMQALVAEGTSDALKRH